MILICKKCKTKLPSEANFCFHCGMAVGLTEEEKKEQERKSEQQLRSMSRIGKAIMEAQIQAQMQESVMGMSGIGEGMRPQRPQTPEEAMKRREEAYRMRMPHDIR